MLTQPSTQLPTIPIRQPDIEQDSRHVGRRCQDRLFRRMDRRHRLHHKAAGSLKLLSDGDAKFDVIIDDQDAIDCFHDD